MNYEYVTENNLINRQKYEYSSYGGKDFIHAYIESRQKCRIPYDSQAAENSRLRKTVLEERIDQLRQRILEDGFSRETKKELDRLIQSFEVRKRLYSNSDSNWKPMDKDGEYMDYNAYLCFAQTLEAAYKKKQNLKYLSCLLKLDDTILSIADQLDQMQLMLFSSILEKELEYVRLLTEKLNIDGKERHHAVE